MEKNNLNFVFGLVAVEELAGNFDEALVLTEQLIATYPYMRPLLVLKGRLLAKQLNLKDARRYFVLSIDGMEEKNLPFVNDVKVHLALLEYLEEGERPPEAPIYCDYFYVYHWCFAQLIGDKQLLECPESGLKEYFNNPLETQSVDPDTKFIQALGVLETR